MTKCEMMMKVASTEAVNWIGKEDAESIFNCLLNEEKPLGYLLVQAALDLIENHGFTFARYLATEYHEYELETVFIKDACLSREELDIREVFGEV